MRFKTLISLLPVAAFGACQTHSDLPVGSAPTDLTEEQMAEMRELGTPGPEHQSMMGRVGRWNVTVKARPGPNDEWRTETGTSQVRAALDGRYFVEEIDATVGGLPYKGFVISGYDRLQERYFGIWMDSHTTWPSAAFGERDDEGVVHLNGRMHDVHTPGGRPVRMEIRKVSDNEYMTQMFDTFDGQDVEVMEIHRTRIR